MANDVKSRASRDIKASEREIASFTDILDNFLRRNLKRLLRDLKSGETSAIEAAKMLGGLKSSLEQAGLEEQIRGLNSVYGNELDRVRTLLGKTLGEDISFSNFDVDALEKLITFDVDATSATVSRYVDDVRSVLMKQVILGEKINPDDLIDGKSDAFRGRIETDLNTTVAGYSRAINQKKAADAGVTKFLYAGPDDERIRPFCAERVNRVFTLDEIKQWDNDQGLPAEVYLGGYNCRHRLIALSDKLAEELS